MEINEINVEHLVPQIDSTPKYKILKSSYTKQNPEYVKKLVNNEIIVFVYVEQDDINNIFLNTEFENFSKDYKWEKIGVYKSPFIFLYAPEIEFEKFCLSVDNYMNETLYWYPPDETNMKDINGKNWRSKGYEEEKI